MSEKIESCPFCGSTVEPGSEFCINCGAALSDIGESSTPSSSVRIISETPSTSQPTTRQYYTPQQQPYQQQQHVYGAQTRPVYTPQPKRNDESAGLVSLIFGILACVGILPCIGSIVAIAAGSNAKGSSTASVGVALGWISLCLSIIGIIVLIVIFSTSYWWYW
ncbi:MAG: zinc-ribbon domain-containing protein [Candidatus Heimdallarchaeota archaeon]